MTGDQQLRAWTDRLRTFGRTGLAAAAREAAPLVQDAARATAAAGTTPDGTPWEPKKSHGRPLEHAAEHITAAAAGPTVRVKITGPDVFHNYGTARSPRRQIIPAGDAPMPAGILAAFKEGARRAFARLVGGGT